MIKMGIFFSEIFFSILTTIGIVLGIIGYIFCSRKKDLTIFFTIIFFSCFFVFFGWNLFYGLSLLGFVVISIFCLPFAAIFGFFVGNGLIRKNKLGFKDIFFRRILFFVTACILSLFIIISFQDHIILSPIPVKERASVGIQKKIIEGEKWLNNEAIKEYIKSSNADISKYWIAIFKLSNENYKDASIYFNKYSLEVKKEAQNFWKGLAFYYSGKYEEASESMEKGGDIDIAIFFLLNKFIEERMGRLIKERKREGALLIKNDEELFQYIIKKHPKMREIKNYKGRYSVFLIFSGLPYLMFVIFLTESIVRFAHLKVLKKEEKK